MPEQSAASADRDGSKAERSIAKFRMPACRPPLDGTRYPHPDIQVVGATKCRMGKESFAVK
jgi:hypothetical protein